MPLCSQEGQMFDVINLWRRLELFPEAPRPEIPQVEDHRWLNPFPEFSHVEDDRLKDDPLLEMPYFEDHRLKDGGFTSEEA